MSQHFIATDTHIRAVHDAAALALAPGSWQSVTGVDGVAGRKGHWHILPGAPAGTALEARRGAAKSASYVLHDLTGVQ